MHKQAEEHEAWRCSPGADRAVSQQNPEVGRKVCLAQWDVLFLPMVGNIVICLLTVCVCVRAHA